MNVTVNETYSDEEIVLDYHKYVECSLRVLKQNGHARLMLDLGRVDPNDFSANGHHGS